MGIDQRTHGLVKQLQHFPLIGIFLCIIIGHLEKIKSIIGAHHIFPQLREIVGDTGRLDRIGSPPLIHGKFTECQRIDRADKGAVRPPRTAGKRGDLSLFFCQYDHPPVIFPDGHGGEHHPCKYDLIHAVPFRRFPGRCRFSPHCIHGRPSSCNSGNLRSCRLP